jgi:hypothetical protein
VAVKAILLLQNNKNQRIGMLVPHTDKLKRLKSVLSCFFIIEAFGRFYCSFYQTKISMEKQIWFFIPFCVLFSDINAQRGNNTVSANIETTIPIFQNDRDFGFFLKGSYGIDRFGQLTFSGGVSKFNFKNSIEQVRITTRLVPFLFGYKQNIGSFLPNQG